VQFLREKSDDLPDEEAVLSRLIEFEELLPAWEQKRYVLATLTRSATLEQLEQWQAALTLLEEALRAYPAAEELLGAAQRVREASVEHERRRKLARRIDLIEQRIDAESWRPALALLESTQSEFPGDLGLEALRDQIEAGQRRADCEAVVTEVRQHLADGELEQAEAVLRRGRKSLGAEHALDVLREELIAEKKYRDDLRAAQVLFGRRQLPEAEQLLAPLASHGRAEARALLEAVREARAATEEEDFCERGRQKALELIQQQQFAQAADLLRNLLSLFPGNPLLERDLMTAQAGLEPKAAAAAPVAECPPAPPPALPVETPAPSTGIAPLREIAPSRLRRAAIAGTASLLLVSAIGAAWKLSRGNAPVTRPPASPPATQLSAAPAAPVSTSAAPTASSAPVLNAPGASAAPSISTASTRQSRAQAESPWQHAAAVRQFVAPSAKQAVAQNSMLPVPPGAEPVISAEAIPGLPVVQFTPGEVPTPPAAPPSAQPAVAAASAPAPKPALPSGGNFQEAQLVSRMMPVYPALARLRNLYGVVRMDAVIDERGDVKNVRVLSGDPVLAGAAKNSILMWRYKPATLNGKPIATSVSIQIVFGDRNK
jgi:protein TonB